jgi:hypothetical protein
MKSEERHELKENDLASWLQFGLWAFLKQNGSYVLLVVALGFLGFQLWRLYEQRQENERRAAWAELRSATMSDEPADFLNVIEKYQYKPVQAEAYLDLGGCYQRLILDPARMVSKKLGRDECLTKAQGYYKSALDVLGSDPLVGGKAHLGIAAALEDQGEWDKARAEYQILADESGPFAGKPYQGFAEAHLEALNDRKNAPRLASMIPPPAPPTPSPSSMVPSPNNNFPGILEQSIGPSLPVTTAPATPSIPMLSPFGPPSLSGPTTPVGPTAPPTAPAPVTPASSPSIEIAPATAPK